MRRNLSKKKRWKILSRDHFTCRYCGRSAPDVKLHIDHVLPVSKGGTDSVDNLVVACCDCNLGKATREIDPRPFRLVMPVRAYVIIIATIGFLAYVYTQSAYIVSGISGDALSPNAFYKISLIATPLIVIWLWGYKKGRDS